MPDSQITVELLDYMGTDLDVVNAARVSFDKESDWEKVEFGAYVDDPVGWVEYKLSDRDTKLIHYLAKHEHYSPFGHNFARFRIKAPVFVARQLV